MTGRLKIVRIGDAEGVILPDEMLARLNWAPGDTLWPTDVEDGVVLTKRLGAGDQPETSGAVARRPKGARRGLA